MKVVLAAHGSRGDVEPAATVGLELQRRGHDVRMAVPPDLVGFVTAAGLAAVGYGPDSRQQAIAVSEFVHHAFRPQNPVRLVRAGRELFIEGWAEMGRTLMSISDGANLLVTGQTYHGVVANIAEYHNIPAAAIHHIPIRVNGHLALPSLPSTAYVVRPAMHLVWSVYGLITRDVDDAQRRDLRLPKVAGPAVKRMADRGSLEIQAYDAVCFPGLAAEWKDQRPFVGALTMEVPTDDDGEVASWIQAGSPPVYFGFGSTPIQSPDDTIAMITGACAELGVRALIYSGSVDTVDLPPSDDVRLVGPLNYAAVFPRCRAVVHHGGAGTTAAALRAGVPMVVLWDIADQPIWAAQITRMKVGRAQRLASITRRALVAHLSAVLEPRYAARAREIMPRMSTSAESVSAAADLLEGAARAAPRTTR
jgi:UDP:flavonoid glycosyltransferase YjiC (YdhE family)